MAVVPADRKVDLQAMAEWVDGDVEIASEKDTRTLFPDCEPGAEPPFGVLYSIPVNADPEIGTNEQVTFNGGTHDTAVRMMCDDYLKLAQPSAVAIVEPISAKVV
jgi:Ala-tRNA(Pro) deacylase